MFQYNNALFTSPKNRLCRVEWLAELEWLVQTPGLDTPENDWGNLELCVT